MNYTKVTYRGFHEIKVKRSPSKRGGVLIFSQSAIL